MPRSIPPAEEQPKTEELQTPERPRFSSLAEAQAYMEWKREVPAAVRLTVESAILKTNKAPAPTGLPRVDAFLDSFSHALQGKEAGKKKIDSQIAQLVEGLRAIETDAGLADGLSMLTSDASFSTKLALYKGHLEPILDWLREQDLAPVETSAEESPSKPEESPSEELPPKESAPESPVPPPESDEFQPSMDEMEKGKEGEPQAYFTVTPFYGGYYRATSYENWDAKRAKWTKSSQPEDRLRSEPVDPLSQRIFKGTVRGGESVILPLPYDWTVLPDSMVTTAGKESVNFTKDPLGTIRLSIQAEGHVEYQLRIGRSRVPHEALRPIKPESESSAALPAELIRLVQETRAASIKQGAKARMLVKEIREHLVYSNESAMNAVYQADPEKYAEAVWKNKKADCDVANTVAALVLRNAEIPCRLVTGHYVKTKSKGGNACLTSGTGHAWLEVWDADQKLWFPADATPKGDPTMDEERPDEQEESGEGDYGEQEAEIMSDEELKKLIESLESSKGKTEERKTAEQRQLEEFAELAGCNIEEARQVRAAIDRVREIKDAHGERIGEQLIREWKKLVHDRMTKTSVYEGPVRLKEGQEPEEMAMIRVDVKAGEQNPQGFMRRRDIEKREKLYGGLDVYLMLDLSGSMSETDPVTGRVKADLQRDFALLYADTLMQCAVVSRRVAGRLEAPLPVRLQVTSIHGGASVDLPLASEWGPKEQVALYRSAFRTAGGGTPDHYGLLEIEKRINHEREDWKRKNHTPGEKSPIEFVAVSLDGGSDDPHHARSIAERLRHSGAVVFGYGMTAAARAITATYAPDARVVESLEKHAEVVAKDTIGVFKRLYPKRVKK